MCYITLSNDECDAAADTAFKKLVIGTEAMIVPYRYRNGKTDLGNSVIVNGEEITRYVGSSFGDGKDAIEVINRTYGFKKGIVSYALKTERMGAQGKGKFKVVMFILDNVRQILSSEIDDMEIKLLDVKIAPKQKAQTPQEKVSGLRAKLFVNPDPDPEPKATPKTESKAKIPESGPERKAFFDALYKEFGVERIA